MMLNDVECRLKGGGDLSPPPAHPASHSIHPALLDPRGSLCFGNLLKYLRAVLCFTFWAAGPLRTEAVQGMCFAEHVGCQLLLTDYKCNRNCMYVFL